MQHKDGRDIFRLADLWYHSHYGLLFLFLLRSFPSVFQYIQEVALRVPQAPNILYHLLSKHVPLFASCPLGTGFLVAILRLVLKYSSSLLRSIFSSLNTRFDMRIGKARRRLLQLFQQECSIEVFTFSVFSLRFARQIPRSRWVRGDHTALRPVSATWKCLL